MMADFTEDEVPFYEGCLIVEVHDHRTAAVAEKDEARPSSRSKEDAPNSIHKYNRFITPSPNKPFPKDLAAQINGHGKKSDTNQQDKGAGSADQGTSSASSSPQGQKSKAPVKTRISTLVLFPTQQSRQADLALKACNPRGSVDGGANGVPPTPSLAVPPTPTASGMPPPAKKIKRERMELDSSNIREAEGAMLLATLPPLDLEPTKDARGTIAKLEEQSEALKHRFLPAPKPVTRKRTVAEMAADEAQAAGHERYLLTLDDRNGQGVSVPGGDGQQQAQHFETNFERFKKIEEIKREHAERATQEKLQQAEKERALQDRKQQQQAAAQAQLQQQQAEERNRQDQEQQRAQLQAQQETIRRRQQMVAQQQAQRQQALALGQNAHGHPMPNGQVNGVPVSAPSGMAMANARLQATASQPPASSPMVRQNTPQNMSSPMVGAVAMQASGSSVGAGSPARPPSVVNQPPMAAPMAVSMSARGSQQSHPSGTPRMPNATPNMAHATPISRAQQLANTPRMSQASPPPNMMAPQMQPGMMNNASNAAAHAQMVAASQRNIQQANMFSTNGMNITPQQQQQRLMMQAAAQQQARMQQQLQQNPQLAQNPQLMQQFLMQQQRQQAQAFAQQQAQQGARQNMGNIQGGVQFPSQQAAAMYQMQQQQQLQQLAAQQQAGQSQQQQMQAQQRMGQPGQQIPAHMQQQMMVSFQRLYTQNLPKWLQARGYASPDAVPPQELDAFKRQCTQAARQQIMQVMAGRGQNGQQMSPQQQQQQQQQQQLMFQQQRMQAMQAHAQAQAMQQQQMHMMSQQGL